MVRPDLPEEARDRWMRILRAQIPPHELIIILFHRLTPWGRIMIRGYIEEFKLFRYFPEGELKESAIEGLYDAQAFKQ